MKITKDLNLPHEDLLESKHTNCKSNKFRVHIRRQWRWAIQLRYDIMNKNFIRAIKRQYKAVFDDFVANQGLKSTKSHLIKNTELFASELLASTSIRWWEDKKFNIEVFCIYIMALTQYWMFKKLNVDKNSIEIREQVYSLLYSYSHSRLLFDNYISHIGWGYEKKIYIILWIFISLTL